MHHWTVRLVLVAAIVVTASSAGAQMAAAAPTVDGKEWRELHETTGLSWSQVASVCPTDGVSPCSGSVGGRNLTGWTWATADQVKDLMATHAPGLATAEPPVVAGIDGFWGAVSFLGVMRWTTYTSLTYFYSESTSGWTASRSATSDLPIAGGADYSHRLAGSTAEGSIGLGTDADTSSSVRGVFLWRPADGDYTPPIVTPTVTGTLGNNGWYRSDVSVEWSVTDDESPVVSREGCDESTVSADVDGKTFTCTATSSSAAGPGTASVTIKRDATPPTITCGTSPTFELGQPSAFVTGTVTDALSGPVSASTQTAVSTASAGTYSAQLVAHDQAGNEKNRTCGYTVVVPKCDGMTPTLLGTGGNDVITGTPGRDVIHALAGSDKVSGLGAGDTLCGGDGNDVIKGGGGRDTVDGGDGNDELFGGASTDTLDGGAGLDSIRGDDGADRCTSGELRMSSCDVVY